MTTTVRIERPLPNHQNIRIEYQEFNENEGIWYTINTRVLNDSDIFDLTHLWTNRRIVLRECD